MNPNAERVIVVENKVNLLTLPPLKGALALGGLGDGITEIRHLRWLESVPDLLYWGDIDVEGFCILSRLRTEFPHAQSVDGPLDAGDLARTHRNRRNGSAVEHSREPDSGGA